MDARERRLLNGFQRDFPLCAAPYAAVAEALDTTESWVIRALRSFIAAGVVGRVGAVFRPGSIGASTLAAMAVPPARLAAIAHRVSAHPGVNHNYEREHRFNLWFVANAPDASRLQSLLAQVERETVLPVLSLPLLREYHIDLGFDLDDTRAERPAPRPGVARAWRPDAEQTRIVAALQDGLPLQARPYAAIAERAGLARDEGEQRVLRHLREWLRDGIVKRLGVIVRHRPLGYIANVMAVWDVPDDAVDAAGETLAREAGVTLCYRRARALPAWPYNLFCMVHGRDRGEVEGTLDAIGARTGLDGHPHARLFSREAFKQDGARHFAARALHG
ncbi:MAG TPA: Lrp/AsnC family transcriptional regulator [Casimicrobiaceae bacterium]